MEKMSIIPIVGGNEQDFIKSSKIELTNYEVFLDEELSEPSNYRELISVLFNASENDTITFYINTIGGSLATTLAIIEGIKHTNATVAGILMGETHSGGSMIAMYCPQLVILDSAEMMVHHASYGSHGTANNVARHAEFATRRVEALLDEAYAGFLTDEEITDVKKGVELWFTAAEIRERAEKRAEHLRELYGDDEDDELCSNEE